MSLLVSIPDWVLDPGSMKDDFGMPLDGLKQLGDVMKLHFSDENVAKRAVQTAILTDQLLTVSGDIKAKCEAYNTSLETQGGDVILISQLNCDDFDSLKPVFSGEVQNFEDIQNQLISINALPDFSNLIQIPTEIQIDNGIVKGHKKLLKKFLLHVMINGFYTWTFELIPIKIDLGKQVSEIISVVAGIAELISVISFMMTGYTPPFGNFSVPLPVGINDGVITDSAENLYYLGIKPYNKAHKDYLKKLNEKASDYYSDEKVALRQTEYNSGIINYNTQLSGAIAQITQEINNLNTQLSGQLTTIATEQVDGDTILISKIFYFPPVSGDVQIQYSNECYDNIITELNFLDDYCSGSIDLIKSNTDLIKIYNDFVRSNIVKSYADYVNISESSSNAYVDAKTFSEINSGTALNNISTSYATLGMSTGDLGGLNISDSGVLSKSIELIFNKTDVIHIKDFIPYYQDNTTSDEKQTVINSLEELKPYLKGTSYIVEDELGILVNELIPDFSIQNPNHYQPKIMFSQSQTDYAIGRITVLETAVIPVVASLKKKMDDAYIVYQNATGDDVIPAKSAWETARDLYNYNKEVLDKLTRLRIYYEQKPLQYLINDIDFNSRLVRFQQLMGGILSEDSEGNLIETPDTEITTFDINTFQNQYNIDKTKFEDLVKEKITATDFTFSIKNFVGSEVITVSENVSKTTSQFESDYNQMIFLIDKLENADEGTQKLIDTITSLNQEQETIAISEAERLRISSIEAFKNIKYTYSKNAVLKIIRYYMDQEKAVNSKLNNERESLQSQIDNKKQQIANLASQLSSQLGNATLIANIQSMVDSQKAILDSEIVNLQVELDTLPENLDLSNYYLYLLCSPITKLTNDLATIQEQLAAGPAGFKAFKIPKDPFDELYNGCYYITKYYMKHLYNHMKLFVALFNFGFPWYTVGHWKPEFLHEGYIKDTAKQMAEDIRNNGGGNTFDEMVSIFVSNKIKKYLSLHLIRFSNLAPYVEPLPNPIFWFGAPPFIPPYTVPPTFIPAPGFFTVGNIF